ncbi:hypothetical protein [Streptomyces sp. NPDC058773]|uniref:hypothetical protein n=1 Tax=Streptomyces sp. NPDC058773 TaxID=3346632 RepID=UPI0036B2AA86
MSSSSADRSRPPLRQAVTRLLPAPSVIGFLALLVVLGMLSYAAGAAAGPVAPGLRPDGGTGPGQSTPADDGDMGGMHGMGAAAPRPLPAGAAR